MNSENKRAVVDLLHKRLKSALSILVTGLLQPHQRDHTDTSEPVLEQLYSQSMLFLFRILIGRVLEAQGMLWPVASTARGSLERVLVDVSIGRTDGWTLLLQWMLLQREGDATIGFRGRETFLWKSETCALLEAGELCHERLHSVCDALFAEVLLDAKGQPLGWNAVTPEILGHVYEGMLGYTLEKDETQVLQVVEVAQSTRKSTGSYYTPIELVERLLDETWLPWFERLQATTPFSEQVEALYRIRICDPACGAGLFLVAATKRVVKAIAAVQKALQEVGDLLTLQTHREISTEVVTNCIYGVDINPMAIELCQLGLWMEIGDITVAMGEVTRNIQQGNALLWTRPEHLEQGIVENAFDLVKDFDDNTVRNQIASRHRREFKAAKAIKSETSHSPHQPILQSQEILSDIWMSSLLWSKKKETAGAVEYAPTYAVFEQCRVKKPAVKLMERVAEIQRRYPFFHWHLRFNTVWQAGGFDLMIGNPPYLASRYLSKYEPYFRQAMPKLYTSASGNWDIYIPFVELGIRLLKPSGFQAYVTPNKIIGADYARQLQQEWFFRNHIRSVHDFSPLSLFEGALVSVVIVVIEKKGDTAENGSQTVRFVQYQQDVQIPSKEVLVEQASLYNLPAGCISFPITAADLTLLSWIGGRKVLSDIAELSDGMAVDEAYKIKPYVSDGVEADWEDPQVIKLVNTGTIDPFELLWNTRRLKFLGYAGTMPVVSRQFLEQRYPKRIEQAAKTTVVVAGLSMRLEAAVLKAGVMSGVATVLLQPFEGICPYALCALLNSRVYSNLYKGLFGMSGLTADALNYSANLMGYLPIPAREYLQACHGDIALWSVNEDIRGTDLSAMGQRLTHIEMSKEVRQVEEAQLERVVRSVLKRCESID